MPGGGQRGGGPGDTWVGRARCGHPAKLENYNTARSDQPDDDTANDRTPSLELAPVRFWNHSDPPSSAGHCMNVRAPIASDTIR